MRGALVEGGENMVRCLLIHAVTPMLADTEGEGQ